MLRSTRRREFLYYSGRLVQEAVYYSSNGGASEDSLNVWGNDVGYLKGKIDPYEGKIASIIHGTTGRRRLPRRNSQRFSTTAAMASAR